MVVVTNNNAGWASNGGKYWNNICGKNIIVWRVKKQHAGRNCSSELRERAKFIIYRETSGSYASARDNIKRRLANAGINQDGLIVFNSVRGGGGFAYTYNLSCVVKRVRNEKQILLLLDN
eukprot:GFUD01077741.1.p1 GENE.GFUD01077741.1~~GFUD01077741.1.p1  ORF type:complete len:120 (+),score=23.26 GFUD01077741.1:1-360(+)